MSENNESVVSKNNTPTTPDDKKIDLLASTLLDVLYNINSSSFKRQPSDQTTLQVQNHLFLQKEKRAQAQGQGYLSDLSSSLSPN